MTDERHRLAPPWNPPPKPTLPDVKVGQRYEDLKRKPRVVDVVSVEADGRVGISTPGRPVTFASQARFDGGRGGFRLVEN